MSRRALLASAAVVVAVVVVVATYVSRRSDAETVRIGAVLPMTGQAAGYGKWIQRGIELAVEDVNASKGVRAKKLEVVIEDSRSDNRAGADAASKLITVDKVPAIVTVLTGVTKSLMPITERHRVVLFTLAMAPGLTEEGKFVFRNATNAANEVDRMISASKGELNFRKAALIHINNATGLWVADHFRKGLEAVGGTVTASESFQPDATDFRTQLTRIRTSQPEALYVLGYMQNGLIMKQARELGLRCRFIGAADCELPDVLRLAGAAAEGTVYTKASFDLESGGKEAQEFASKYGARFGEAPEIYAATAYDAVRIIALALDKTGPDAAKMRQFILSIREYPGASGQTTFLANGDVRKPVELKKIENGRFVPFRN